jgi:hypothetical protein
LGWNFFFATVVIKHSLAALGPLSLIACICIDHNDLLVVRVVGLIFALEMAILGSFGFGKAKPFKLWFFGTTKLETAVQLFKTYKMSLLWIKKDTNFSVHTEYGFIRYIRYLKRWYTVLANPTNPQCQLHVLVPVICTSLC